MKRSLSVEEALQQAYTDKLEYSKAYNLCVTQNKPLLLWVGGVVCPSCEAKMPWAVHCHLYSYQDDAATPRVIVSKPDKDGKIYRVAVFTDHIPTPEEVKKALGGPDPGPGPNPHPNPGPGPRPPPCPP